MLLGILPERVERISQDLLRCMLTAVRVKTAAKQKIKVCPAIESWKEKLAKYAIIAKLINCVNKEPSKEHHQKWQAIIVYGMCNNFPQYEYTWKYYLSFSSAFYGTKEHITYSRGNGTSKTRPTVSHISMEESISATDK